MSTPVADPGAELDRRAAALGLELLDERFAQAMDDQDELRSFRSQFFIPKANPDQESGPAAVYLCGHSLGLQPKTVRAYMEEELKKWELMGVRGHVQGKRPWWLIDEIVKEDSAKLVGAKTDEVVVMNSLTVNLHVMMLAFYRPTATRYKIMIEEKAFPSDIARIHGRDPRDVLVLLKPQPGADALTDADIETAARQAGASLALALLPGVQYIDGSLLDIARCTRAVQAVGAVCGWDLAHAVGNVPLRLHDAGVDFACWCTYKYLNSGPGALGGVFVHERHTDLLRPLAGWWGHEKATRFRMPREFVPARGAAGFASSNPPVWPLLSMRAALDVFAAAGMDRLRAKSLLLTAYMERLLTRTAGVREHVRVLTPPQPQRRGAMLCLVLGGEQCRTVYERLNALGVVCDFREPNVVRVSAAPLYNTFSDVREFVVRLRRALAEPRGTGPAAASRL